MFASDPSRGRQQVEGAEIQFGPRTPMVLKNIEPRPDVNVVCGNIAIDKLSPLSDAYPPNRTGESVEGVTEARDMTVFTSEMVWVTH
jgi:hypothetical protein